MILDSNVRRFRGNFRRLAVAGVLAVSLLGTRGASADSAESDFREGVSLRNAGRCPEAVAKFEHAVKLDPELVGAWLNLGSCLETAGKLVAALHAFENAQAAAERRAAKPGDAQEKEKARAAEASRRALGLRARVATLAVHAPSGSTPPSEIMIDGEVVPLDVAATKDPGGHDVRITIRGREPFTERVVLVEGEHRVLELAAPERSAPVAPVSTSASPVPASPPLAAPTSGGGQRTLGFVLGGVGLAGVAVGAVFGFVTISQKKNLENQCPRYPECPTAALAAAHDADDSARRSATVSTVAFIGGAALLAAGVTLYLTAPRRRDAPAAALSFGAGREPSAVLSITY